MEIYLFHYIDTDLAMKDKALVIPHEPDMKMDRYCIPDDALLQFP